MSSIGSPIPTRLLIPGAADVICPAASPPRTQQLPLNELSFENLQRLSVRLLTVMKGTIHCQEYGTPGQAQEGIDVYARLPGQTKMEVWQCKRYQDITASDISNAVDEFLKGDLVDDTAKFVLVTSAKTEDAKLAKADQDAAEKLKKRQVEFVLMGCTSLTTALKPYPDIIDDFFGHIWVEVCCGREAAESLKYRLSGFDIVHCRNQLRKLYASVFEQADSLLARSLTLQQTISTPLTMQQRWVMPTISCRIDSVIDVPEKVNGGEDEQSVSRKHATSNSEDMPKRLPLVKRSNNEMSAEAFIGSTERGIILGNPGYGKSSLLRVVALDLLSENPCMWPIANRFGNRLPIWIPFAFLSARISSGDSVADAASAWIKKNGGGDELDKLLNRAVKDGRLLLLIDGLDEWSDIDRARETIIGIQGFLSQSPAACFLTARPLGYERLDRLSGNWKHGNLQSLSLVQQSNLASLILRCIRASSSAAVQQIEVDRFMRHLNYEQSLREIASTPLMFVGLVSLWVQNQALPTSRLAICEALIKEMMEDHPSRRAAMSASIPSLNSISSQIRRGALASLAWSMHTSANGAFMRRSEAENCFATFFHASEGMAFSEAKTHARQMLPISDQIIGILSEASPGGDVQFIHRTFQELLAAEHLSSMPINDQSLFCSKHAGDPVWHQILLFLIQRSMRPHETDQLIQALTHPQQNRRDSMLAKLLLAEVVFSQNRMSPLLRGNYASAILDEIESGTWMPFREALLSKILSAPRGTNVYALLIERLKMWLPRPGSFYVYNAIAKWPDDSGAEDALWALMNHEDVSQQVGAAKMLAIRCKNDSVWKDRLIKRLHEPLGTGALGACLYCLAEGWSQDADAISVFEQGRDAATHEIVLPSILGLIRANKHDERCKKQFLKYGDTVWFREIAVAVALEGWPQDREIKQAVLRRCQDRYGRDIDAFSYEAAWEIAIKGYPGDDEIAQAIADEMLKDYPNFGYDLPWEAILNSFAGHFNIITASEKYCSRPDGDVYKDSLFIALGRSEAGKRRLIDWSTTHGRMGCHAVRCLLCAWGKDDADVVSLIQCLRDDNKHVEIYAMTVASLETDKQFVRQKLLRSFDPSKGGLFNATLLHALSEIRQKESDTEIVNAALACYEKIPPEIAGLTSIYTLIDGFGDDPRVRNLAEALMVDIECEWQTIAKAYAGDSVIRNRVNQICRCMPKQLRLQIMNRCQQRGAYDIEFRDIANRFRQEKDQDVRIAGAIAAAESVLSLGEDTSLLVDYFSKELTTLGPRYDVRMYTGFAGLVALEQLDKASDVLNVRKLSFKIRFIHWRDSEDMLMKFVAKNWRKIEKCWGDLFWDSFESQTDFDKLRDEANEIGDTELTEKILAKIRNKVSGSTTRLSLSYIVESRAPQWVQSCFAAMGLTENTHSITVADARNASHLLAKHGAGDENIRVCLENFVKEDRFGAYYAIDAIARGWPKSEVLGSIWNEVLQAQNGDPMRYGILISTCGTAEQFVTWLYSWLEYSASSLPRLKHVEDRWFVMRRCFEDVSVASILMERLKVTESPNEWTSFAWLVRSSPLENAERELREWAEQRWIACNEAKLFVVGFDIFKNEFVSIKETLLELLLTDRRYILI